MGIFPLILIVFCLLLFVFRDRIFKIKDTTDGTAQTASQSRSDDDPISASQSKTFGRNLGYFALAGVAFFAVFNLFGANNGLAEGCVKPEQRYQMLDFKNNCSYPITIQVCTKHGFGIFREALGGRNAKWQCREAYTRPGNIGPSISWTTNSTIGGALLSNAHYVMGACRDGFRVNVNTNTKNYSCTKR